MSKQSVQQRLQKLRLEYAAKLPARVAVMMTCWQALEQQWDVDALETLHRDAHTLSGTAANFGFSAVGDCARELDCCLGPLRGQNQEPDQTKRAEIAHWLQQLQRQAEGAADASGFTRD